jgi:nitroimidazol reductase NimA-like FMN-containing flavoprotein (pyridoxamine 5'-phosphate oxidase superfamily)
MPPLDHRPLRDSDEAVPARDRNGLVVLDRAACFELLRAAQVGRIAVTDEGLPVILPISYGMLDDDIVFCTGAGAKAKAAIDGDVVAFEIDHVDLDQQVGWSVCVVGVASEILDPERRRAVEALGVRPLVRLARQRYIAISPKLVSGRCIAPQPNGAGTCPAEPRATVDAVRPGA